MKRIATLAVLAASLGTAAACSGGSSGGAAAPDAGSDASVGGSGGIAGTSGSGGIAGTGGSGGVAGTGGSGGVAGTGGSGGVAGTAGVGGSGGSAGTSGAGGSGGGSVCTPNSQAPCYTGPSGTEGVGSCQPGTKLCNGAGTGYGACVGDVVPGTQTCSLPALDGDCNGTANEGCCTSGAWTVEPVETTGDVGTDCDIAVDAKGGVHISYYDATMPTPTSIVGDLRYAYRPSGGSFTATAVHSQGNYGVGTSIAVDKSGGVHVSYFSAAGSELWYAHKPAGGSWTTSKVTNLSAGYVRSAIAVDGLGTVNIVYKGADQLRHAKRPPGGSWAFQTIDPSSKGGNVTLVLDSAGLGHVVATSFGIISYAGNLYARENSGGGWSTTAAGYSQGYMGLDIDATDTLHIAFGGGPSPYLRYESKKPGTTQWTGDNCWGPGLCTPASSDLDIGIDATGIAHVVYHDVVLRYGERLANSNWNLEVIDSQGDVGSHLALDMDTGGGVHVAYYDATNKDLKYAYRCP